MTLGFAAVTESFALLAVDDGLVVPDAPDARQFKLYHVGILGWAAAAGNPAAALAMISVLYKCQGPIANPSQLTWRRSLLDELEDTFASLWECCRRSALDDADLPETRLVVVGPHPEGGNWWLTAYLSTSGDDNPEVDVHAGRVLGTLDRFTEAICVGDDAYRAKVEKALRASVGDRQGTTETAVGLIRERAQREVGVNPSGHAVVWDGRRWTLLRFGASGAPHACGDILAEHPGE